MMFDVAPRWGSKRWGNRPGTVGGGPGKMYDVRGKMYDGGFVEAAKNNFLKDRTRPLDDGRCQMEDEGNENDNDNENAAPVAEELNYFAPMNSLQLLLRQPWFNEARSEEKYDSKWTDAFVEALMGSEYGEGIARDWAVQGLRERKNQVRGYVVGLLKDNDVLKGSYRSIAAEVGIIVNEGDKNAPYRTFADYMGRGKRQPYAEWVKVYVGA